MDDAAAAEHAEEYLEQVEEAEALAAILERDFAVRSRATGRELRDLDVLRSDPRQPGDLVFQVAVEVEIPFEAGLRVALPDSTAAAGPSSAAEPGGGGGPTGLAVEHLPKVQLLMVLPPAYPAAAAPHAVVHCAWLGRGEKERVNAELARQCDENAAAGGGPMGFFLADWLKNELLAFLGVADRGELRLGPPEGVAPGVQRKVVAKTAAKLAAHDEAMRERAFNRGTHTCPICFEPKAGLASLRLACSHAFCRACLRQHAEVNVREGSLGAIRCPDTACRVALGPADLRKVLPAEVFERWETLTLERSLDQMEDVQYCPRCTAVCVRDPEEEAALCGTCFYSFCTLCLGARHPGTECLNAEQKLEILRNRTKNHREVQAEVLRKKRELEADIAAQKYVRLNCKTCPKCRNAIEKSGGCNKMTCGGCGTYLCFKCGRQIAGYSHFQNGECKLFDEMTDEELWYQMRLNELPPDAMVAEAAQVDPALRAQVKVCPYVLRLNNNNHMGCWNCGHWFCGLCRTPLRKGESATHFGPGPGKCKQHTQDPDATPGRAALLR